MSFPSRATANCIGGTNYKGQIAFLGEGQGPSVAPAIYTLNPYPPYETKVILDNYWGIQFSSLNDVAVNPRNKELYFTDPQYGYFQDFRPKSALPNQVYRFNEETGAVVVVADGFDQPNGGSPHLGGKSTGYRCWNPERVLADSATVWDRSGKPPE